jgi:hypothetical protein
MPAKQRYKPSRRVKPKRSRVKKIFSNRFVWFGAVGCVLVGGIVYGVFFTHVFQIKYIEVEGTQKVSSEKLQEIAQEYTARRFVFFSFNHVLLANTQHVTEEIQNAFPEIEKVAVRTILPDKVRISVQERQAVATWCQHKTYVVEVSDTPENNLEIESEAGSDEPRKETGTRSFEECFALDGNGVIYEKEEAGNRIIVEQEERNAVLGEQVVDPETLAKLLRFQNQVDSDAFFREVGIRVSGFRIVSKERVNARISEGWEFYINLTEDISWQSTKGLLVLKEEVPFEKRHALDYIDLRFGDQAYIKYR